MREKSIREKLGKAFSKWIVITLLAGMLVPAMPREVKAATEKATFSCTAGGPMTLKFEDLTVGASYNAIIKLTQGDSSAEIGKIEKSLDSAGTTEWPIDIDSNTVKNLFEDAKNRINTIVYPVKVKIELEKGNTPVTLASGATGEIRYTPTTISTNTVYVPEDGTVDLSQYVKSNPEGKITTYAEGSNVTKIGEKFKLTNPNSNGTVKITVADGYYSGVSKEETVRIEKKDTPTFSSTKIYASTIDSNGKTKSLPTSTDYPIEWSIGSQSPSDCFTLNSGKITAASTGYGTVIATFKGIYDSSGNNPKTETVNVYVNPITITNPIDGYQVKKGSPISLEATVEGGSASDLTWKYIHSTGSVQSLKPETSILGTSFTPSDLGNYKIRAELNSDSNIYSDIVVTSVTSLNPTKVVLDQDTITAGYKLPLSGTAKLDNGQNAEAQNITFSSKSSGSPKITSITPSSSGTTTVYATVKDSSGTAVLSNYPIEIDVLPKPTIKYNTSDKTLEITLPDEIVTGTTETKEWTVTGCKVEASCGGKTTSKTYKNVDDISDVTISKSDVEEMSKALKDGISFSADSEAIKFTVIPIGDRGDGKENQEIDVKADTGTSGPKMYRITASGTNGGTNYYYGLEGDSISISASPNTGYAFEKWSDNNTSNPRSVTVKTTTSSNKYTYTVKATQSPTPGPGTTVPKAGGAAGDGLDSVPKTAQNMIPFFMIMLAAFAAAAVVFVLVKNTMGQPAGSNIPESLKLLDFSSKNDKDKK